MPSISVVIPSYNHARYIGAALESVERQTYSDLEIVVIDDGSTDESLEVIGAFARSSKVETRVHAQPNAGAHLAIERGISLARARHIAILNSDDVFHPERLAELMREVPSSGPYIAFSELDFIDAGGAVVTDDIHNRVWYREVLKESELTPGIGFGILCGNFSMSTSNFLFSREMRDLVGSFRPYKTAHDMDFLLRCTYYCEPVFVRRPLLQYRLHASNTINANRTLERHEVERLFLDYVERAAAEAPPNPLAPGSSALPAYSDYFLRERPLWFAPDRSGAPFEQLRERSLGEHLGSEDASALRREMSTLASRIQPVEEERDRWRDEARNARTEIKALTASTSWRVTKPLRRLKNIVES